MLARTRFTRAVIVAASPLIGAASMAPARSRKIQPPCGVSVTAASASSGPQRPSTSARRHHLLHELPVIRATRSATPHRHRRDSACASAICLSSAAGLVGAPSDTAAGRRVARPRVALRDRGRRACRRRPAGGGSPPPPSDHVHWPPAAPPPRRSPGWSRCPAPAPPSRTSAPAAPVGRRAGGRLRLRRMPGKVPAAPGRCPSAARAAVRRR